MTNRFFQVIGAFMVTFVALLIISTIYYPTVTIIHNNLSKSRQVILDQEYYYQKQYIQILERNPCPQYYAEIIQKIKVTEVDKIEQINFMVIYDQTGLYVLMPYTIIGALGIVGYAGYLNKSVDEIVPVYFACNMMSNTSDPLSFVPTYYNGSYEYQMAVTKYNLGPQFSIREKFWLNTVAGFLYQVTLTLGQICTLLFLIYLQNKKSTINRRNDATPS